MTVDLFRRLAVAMLAAELLTASAGAAKSTSIQRGRDLVERNCGTCHATGASGESPLTPAPPFRELHRRYPIDNLEEAMSEGILTGHPQMPQFLFLPWETTDIINYLKSIQTVQHADAPASRAPTTPAH